MAKYNISAERHYISKMQRNYELELDEGEFLSWLNAQLEEHDAYPSIASIPVDKLKGFLGYWIDNNHREKFHNVSEVGEVEVVTPRWRVDMNKVDEEVAA